MTAPSPKILIVEDTALLRNLISRHLQAAGLTQIFQAKNGQEGIAMAQAHQPDIVLLDIIMPGMLGTEALPELRRLLPGGTIIMMSSLSESDVVSDCKEKGADGFVLKTGDGIAQAVMAKVRSGLTRQMPTASPPEAKPPQPGIITPFASDRG